MGRRRERRREGARESEREGPCWIVQRNDDLCVCVFVCVFVCVCVCINAVRGFQFVPVRLIFPFSGSLLCGGNKNNTHKKKQNSQHHNEGLFVPIVAARALSCRVVVIVVAHTRCAATMPPLRLGRTFLCFGAGNHNEKCPSNPLRPHLLKTRTPISISGLFLLIIVQ